MKVLKVLKVSASLGLCWLLGIGITPAQVLAPQQLEVLALADAPDLVCPTLPRKKKPARPVASPAPVTAEAAPLDIPDEQEVEQARAALQGDELGLATIPPALGDRPVVSWPPVAPQTPFRVAFWGDSHLAAGFFTQELTRRLGLLPEQVHSAFVPATMNRAGVRLSVRKSCVSSHWRHESAHAWPAAAQAPGPALVNLLATQPGASLAWDLRDAQRAPQYQTVRLLYQQTEAPVRIGLRVDGGAEQALWLQGPIGPAALQLSAAQALSTLELRLIEGPLRIHGVGLPVPATARLQLDLMAYPGATVRGWQNAAPEYLQRWFSAMPPYQLVVLAYGTNEANEKPFDANAYQQTLRQSVGQLRRLFPDSACLLIGPGDRGVLVARARATKKTAHKPPVRASKPPVGDLLRYSLIHEQVTRIQQAVGTEMGCQSWSMLHAMGGVASAYRWVRQQPPLMARDLIHFTVPGYQHLAGRFVQDLGWSAQTLWLPPSATP